MKFNIKKFIKVIALIFFLYLIGLKYITTHEFIHSQIFNKYQIDYITNFDYTLNGYTIPTNESQYFENCNDSCKSLNIINDIVGYYFAIFLLFIFILYMFKNERGKMYNMQ